VVALLKDRSRTLNELADEALLFYRPVAPADDLLAQYLVGASVPALRAFAEHAAAAAWDRPSLAALIRQLVAEFGLKMPQVAVPLRVAVTGRTQTPSIDAVLELIGREAVVERVRQALARRREG
jgi:glutamyl-tRNA synthetase